uniref:ATP synthase F0 subunit 8 n=1 Tax=Thysanostoma flagellatum TaxID=3287591 RepID=UPI001FA6E317|nr:ATP synthase F0 subunit 8 [Acromitus flagellatus]UMY76046.1 ATP synthase F0 subunit 8 [Acromitus flagellatus]
MPQLDVVTFVNQYLWAIGSLSFMVLISIVLIMPSMKQLIEIRDVTVAQEIFEKREKSYESLRKLLNY